MLPKDFDFNIEYDNDIDDFLYKKVGYDILNQMVVGVFPSPYAATSVSEYFARGLEEYFIGDNNSLKEMSPVLFRIINKLVDMEDQ